MALVQLFLVPVCLLLAENVHKGWFTLVAAAARPGASSRTPTPHVYAPDAYRILMPTIISALHHLVPAVSPLVIMAALDFCFVYLAASLLYRALLSTLPATISAAHRLVYAALFLATLYFPLQWIVPWQRPETTPSACFVALALFALTRTKHKAQWTILLAAATILQAFTRADVAFVFGLAMIIAAGIGYASEPRLAAAAKGAMLVVIAGLVQAYLQFIKFPHLSYPPGDAVLQLGPNFLLAHNVFQFVTVLLPVFMLLAFLAVKRPALLPLDVLILVASGLYACLWLTVGSVQEARIFVPYMFALCVVAARVFGTFVLGLDTRMPLKR